MRAILTTIFSIATSLVIASTSAEGNYLQISDIKVDGNMVITTHKHNHTLSIHSRDDMTQLRQWRLDQPPTGVCSDGKLLYVTTFESYGELIVIDPTRKKILKQIDLESGSCAPILNEDKNKLYVCNRYAATLSIIDLKSLKVEGSIKLLREPCNAIYDGERQRLYVTNFLPIGRADIEHIGASVTVVDTQAEEVVKHIQLASGSNALRGVSMSEDGKYLFTTHNLGRFQLPTSQLQQGWMNTSAMSVISLDDLKYEASILLDEPDRGAAGIWDVKCSDGKIVISHSGVHELSIIDYQTLKSRYEEFSDKESLSYNLRFMEGIRKRLPIKGNGPRTIAISDGEIFVPTFFSDTLNIVSLQEERLLSSYAMIEDRVVDDVLLGEQYFNDAALCFQNWQSCNGCHPGDARTDGLNWDLLNDGIGNPKNCKSLLFGHKLPPAMITGVRESSYLAVRTGFRFIQFHDIKEEYAECVDAYLLSLQPVPSPLLTAKGELSERAKRGEEIFNQLGCNNCHNGEYYTDQKMYRIGDDVEFEKGWDTPTLREVWRTAPYLFDGRAATMEDLIVTHRHGVHRALSEKEVEDLVEFVNSL